MYSMRPNTIPITTTWTTGHFLLQETGASPSEWKNLAPGGSEISDTCDEIADAHHSCLIAYGNETEDWPNCIMALETSCKELAKGADITARIESSLKAAKSNHEQKQLKEVCWFCKKNKGDPDCLIEIAMYGNVKRESAKPRGFDSLMLNDFKMIKGKCSCRVYQ